MESIKKRSYRRASRACELSALFCWLGLIGLLPVSLNAAFLAEDGPEIFISATGFTGPYALSNFTLTNTNLNPSDPIPANGFAEVTPAGSLVLTGSNTGSGLMPGATTYLTIASRGTGQVSFDWLYSSLDVPQLDVGGYILNSAFVALADSDGRSGSVSFPVALGQTLGFGVRTLDNAGEPGILTIRNFDAPVGSAVIPEPGTSGFMWLAVGSVISLWPYRRAHKLARESNR